MKNYEKIYGEIIRLAESTAEFAYEKGTYKSAEEAIADVIGHSDDYITAENFKKYEDEDITADSWYADYKEQLEDIVREWYEADKEEEED